MPRPHGDLTTIILAGVVAIGLTFVGSGSVFAQASITPPGAGTSGDPYQISLLGHLVWIGDNVAASSGKYYTMTADIDASQTATWNDEGTGTELLEGLKPIGSERFHFAGIFEGNGHAVSGLVINRPAAYSVGLFAFVGKGGQVRSLGMIGGTVTGQYDVGGLVGENYQGTVLNSYATNTVTGHYRAGGMVGTNVFGTVSNCYAAGAVTGHGDVGGLIGQNYYGTVANCYATGAVTGEYTIGGLVGDNDNSTILNCYATGVVTGSSNTGGLVARNFHGSVSNSYWNMQTSGQITSVGGTGKTTAELKQQTTFAGWDFTNVWDIAEGLSYSYLRFSPPPFKLTLNISGPGTVAADPASADGTYAPETVVRLTAVPNGAADVFSHWNGASSSESSTASVVLDIHRSVTAVFLPKIEISSLAELAKIGNDPGYPLTDILYVLTADIDASQTATWNDEGTGTDLLEGFKPIGNSDAVFTGIFDGQGRAISGLVINRPAENNAGLFGSVGIGGQVRNLGLIGGSVTGQAYVGGLIGRTSHARVSYCYATGAVTASGAYVGGLVGDTNSGKLLNCYATGAVTGSDRIGGLVGANRSCRVSNCYAAGVVIGAGSQVGGLFGGDYHGTVSNCYATGAVTGAGSDVGGLIGYIASFGSVSNSYWDMQTSGWSTSTWGGTGKTTAEMKQQTTFTNWDLATVWGIAEGTSYPYLQFSPPPFRLTIGIVGAGGVTVDPASADGTYAPGTMVTLTATPAEPSDVFIQWMGALPSESPEASLVMDIHKSATAVFFQRIEINSLADLAMIGNDPGYPLTGVLYVLMADINASETTGWNDAGTETDVLEGFKPIGNSDAAFDGIFDGNGHTISGLVSNRPGEYYAGLFGHVGSVGQVLSLGLIGGSVTGSWYVGSLIGKNSGTVSNCYATGAVTASGSYVGGLVGLNDFGTVSDCYANGAVTGYLDVGGLVGGTIGYGKVSNCYATGGVTASGSIVGGLIGNKSSFSTVSNCYATGAVTAPGSYVGGLVGYDSSSDTVSSSYWDTQTSGQSTSAGGEGKTTADMMQRATFTGWNFSMDWGIVENLTYPYLLSMPPDLDTDGVLDWLDACPATVPGVTVDAQGCPPAVHGDFDRDGDIDASDLAVLAACVSAPAVLYDPAALPTGCTLTPDGNGKIAADFDADGDVDQDDFGIFQRCYSGADKPADPDCAN